MRVGRLAYGLGLAALAATGGCASGGGKREGTTVMVRVENDATPAAPVTVWLAPTGGGDRRSLGVVPPTSTRLLRVGDLDGGTEYRLTAERQTGASSSSQPFRPGSADVVDWRLSTNVLLLLQAAVP